MALFSSLVFAQDRNPITIGQIEDLLKDGVRSSRIAQLVEQYGVDFELDETALKRLRAAGADEVLLSAVKKMAARYEDQQRKRRADLEEKQRQQAEAERKKQEEVRRAEEARKRTQEIAKQGDLEKRRAEEAGRQSKRPDESTERLEDIRKRLQAEARRREEEKKLAEEQKRRPLETEKKTREAVGKSEEAKRRAPEEAKQKAPKGASPTLRSQEEVGRIASVRNVVSTAEGEVSGEIANNSTQTLRDVQLQILYSWRWKNEYHPGKEDPGRASYYVLDREIPSGQTARFNYKPSPPFAARTDGEFDITVKVVGFAEVFPGGAAK
jgi:hypothetical protein